MKIQIINQINYSQKSIGGGNTAFKGKIQVEALKQGTPTLERTLLQVEYLIKYYAKCFRAEVESSDVIKKGNTIEFPRSADDSAERVMTDFGSVQDKVGIKLTFERSPQGN